MSSLKTHSRGYCVIVPQFHAARLDIEALLTQNGIIIRRSFEKRFLLGKDKVLRAKLPECLVGQHDPCAPYIVIRVEADNLDQRLHDIRWHVVPETNIQFRDACFWPISDEDAK